jgi:DNA polymerase
MSSPSRAEALATLAWIIELGADEAVGEVAINRFAAQGESRADPAAVSDARSRPKSEPEGVRVQVPAAQSPRPSSPPAPESEDQFGHAMAIAANCGSLAELRAALERYEGSQLKQRATNTVFADGVAESRIMIIGEAPGYDEDRQGLPFVGRAGKLLDRMLAAIALDRRTTYITNVLPWRPPDNRNPEATEVAQCIPFLRRHIELAQPQVMILLGAVSVRHVLGLNEGIMRYRGRWMEYRVGDAMIPVMPTLHPAYLLRQPAHKKLAWRDLQAVREKIDAFGLAKSASPLN